jgi:hypothetical protein
MMTIHGCRTILLCCTRKRTSRAQLPGAIKNVHVQKHITFHKRCQLAKKWKLITSFLLLLTIPLTPVRRNPSLPVFTPVYPDAPTASAQPACSSPRSRLLGTLHLESRRPVTPISHHSLPPFSHNRLSLLSLSASPPSFLPRSSSSRAEKIHAPYKN